MNRTEVITTIAAVGNRFARVMASLCSQEYVAGYRRAVSDMTRLFSEAPIDPDFEAERNALYAEIDRLQKKNDELEQEVCNQHASIEELLKHVNLPEVLGINVNGRSRQEPREPRRIVFWSK